MCRFDTQYTKKAEASSENLHLERAADRAERIAANPKVGRPEARGRQAEAARAKQTGFVSKAGVKAGVVSSGAATAGLKLGQEVYHEAVE